MNDLNTEIEFKFLVTDDEWKQHIIKSTYIVQGYLTDECASQAIRVRLEGGLATLCIKYPTESAYIRAEYEYPIPLADAQDMLDRTSIRVTKIRHIVEYNGLRFEVDEFHDNNEGLVIAEYETTKTNMMRIFNDGTVLDKIGWLGKDVTEDIQYLNCILAKNKSKK